MTFVIHYYNPVTPSDYWCPTTIHNVPSSKEVIHSFSSELRETNCPNCLSNLGNWFDKLRKEKENEENLDSARNLSLFGG